MIWLENTGCVTQQDPIGTGPNKIIETIISLQECAPGSLNDVTLSNLIVISNVNADCLNEARAVFKRSYDLKNFVITFIFGPELPPDGIQIGSMLFAQNILTNFGDLIHHLDFSLIGEFNGKLIIEYINEKCSRSLESLVLRDCKGSPLSKLTNKFENVHSMTFSANKWTDLIITNYTLSDIFPNVRNLIIVDSKASDWKFIEGKFNKLAKFDVKLPNTFPYAEYVSLPNGTNETHVISFLKVNRQIRDFSVSFSSFRLLKAVNSLLPQLETLSLKRIQIGFANNETETVDFLAVKRLTFFSRYGEVPKKTLFKHLQRLVLHFDAINSEQWEFFLTNQVSEDVDDLEIHCEWFLPGELVAIPKLLRNLQRTFVTSNFKFKASDIVNYIERSKSLCYLRIIVGMDSSEVEKLDDLLPENWNAQYISAGFTGVEIIFQKFDDDDDDDCLCARKPIEQFAILKQFV